MTKHTRWKNSSSDDSPMPRLRFPDFPLFTGQRWKPPPPLTIAKVALSGWTVSKIWWVGTLTLAIGNSECSLTNHLVKSAFARWTVSKIYPIGELAWKTERYQTWTKWPVARILTNRFTEQECSPGYWKQFFKVSCYRNPFFRIYSFLFKTFYSMWDFFPHPQWEFFPHPSGKFSRTPVLSVTGR